VTDPAAVARRQAQQILAERRFHGTDTPRPLHGALVWIGERLRPLARPFQWLAAHVPGGEATVWTLGALAVVLLAAGVAGRVASRRGSARVERLERSRRAAALDPAALEREADEAETAGDLARALRLRYRAGFLQLGRLGALPLRESLTSGEARRLLRLREFDALARTHDQVVYGGRAASPTDATEAREGWRDVVAAVAR
jgi:hypothetical protein